MKEKYGEKVMKISLNAGLTCPNRDGASGRRGCVFCNENAFSRYAGTGLSLREQIDSSIESARERGINKFIAYFQNATNTNAEPSKLREIYDVVREYPDIVAISISTRPDCVDDEKLDVIREYTRDHEVWVEYGIQTVHDRSLELLKRGHTYADSVNAVRETYKRGIKVGAHIILGIPGESKKDMITTAGEISGLGIDGVKLHVMQVFRGTELEKMYDKGALTLMDRAAYVQAACDFLENLRPGCVVLRLVSDAKEPFLVAPEWSGDKLPVINGVEAEFKRRGTRQGEYFSFTVI